MPRPYACPKCSRRHFTVVKLIKHIGLIHAHEHDFSICCGLDGCQNYFFKYESFRRHVYRKHRTRIWPSHNNVTGDDEVDISDNEVNTDTADDTPEDVVLDMNDLLTNFRGNLVSFVLKCREKNVLPQSVQQEILQDVKFLFSFFKENYDSLLSYHLKQNGFNIEEIPELVGHLQSFDFFAEACKVIDSEHLFKEYCISHLDMIEPVQHTIRDVNDHAIGNFAYVPIMDVLKKYCSHEDVWDCIHEQNIQPRDEHVLRDYNDGKYFKEHPFFSKHPDALRLHFYEDEFEVVNPLGSKRNKHKLCAIYYSVGNIDVKHRSQLKHIHLALLVKHSLFKQHMDIILKPLLDDLKLLSTDGFDLMFSDKTFNVRAALASISGDNLSAHMIGGFSMSFNSGRICRYCMATHSNKRVFQ